MNGILEDLGSLTAHHVFQAVMQQQVELLDKAKQELANVPTSLSDSDFDEQPGTANQFGDGNRMLNNFGGSQKNIEGGNYDSGGGVMNIVYFGAQRRQKDGAGQHTDEVEVSRRLRCQYGPCWRAEVDDGIHFNAMTQVCLIKNDVQYLVAGAIKQLQASVGVLATTTGNPGTNMKYGWNGYGTVISLAQDHERLLRPCPLPLPAFSRFSFLRSNAA
ncbi:hypothetical protein DL765_010727 [Monosporascus sp. GIB2]|nr:hypothetical protein DL765_010727 [Monosporascus sp. GIB2]